MKKNVVLVSILICIFLVSGCKRAADDTGPNEDCSRGVYPDQKSGYMSKSYEIEHFYRTEENQSVGEHGKVVFKWWCYPHSADKYSENPWMVSVFESENECVKWHRTYFHVATRY